MGIVKQPSHFNYLERVMGIEPTLPAWEADILPLNYTRLLSPVYSNMTCRAICNTIMHNNSMYIIYTAIYFMFNN